MSLRPPDVLALAGHGLRWQLLRELARSDRQVRELTGLIGQPQSLVSYHLARLRAGGLVATRRSSADRREAYYRIDLARCAELFGDAAAALHPGLRPGPPADAPRVSSAARVLFLCTGNSARSQMAEALLERRSEQRIAARSAGSRPKPLHPNAVRVMADRGIDIADRPTKHLDRFARMRFDRIITLCDKVREICPDFPGPPVAAHWSIADPAGGATDDEALPAFERVADELEVRISLLINELSARSAERKTHAE